MGKIIIIKIKSFRIHDLPCISWSLLAEAFSVMHRHLLRSVLNPGTAPASFPFLLNCLFPRTNSAANTCIYWGLAWRVYPLALCFCFAWPPNWCLWSSSFSSSPSLLCADWAPHWICFIEGPSWLNRYLSASWCLLGWPAARWALDPPRCWKVNHYILINGKLAKNTYGWCSSHNRMPKLQISIGKL